MNIYLLIKLFVFSFTLIPGTFYEDMLECGVIDINDDLDFKDKVCYSENKSNEKKKSKIDVSFIF